MPKSELLASLDLGSHRVTALIARVDPDTHRIKVLGSAVVPCLGLKGGVVVNIADAARAVTRAVEEAESRAQTVVREVILGVCGSHVQSYNNSGKFNIARTDKEITAEDVASVIENAKAIHISNDRVILHTLPQGFSLDRQRGVPNPVGMEGSYLETEVHIVTASRSHLKNLIKAVNEAGFEVAESIYSLLAVGELVVSPEEKELGCLLIDLGGQVISFAIYAEGAIRFSKELELGSDFITRDLAYGLKTTMGTAKLIKERYGAALTTHLNGEEDVPFIGIDGHSTQTIKTKTLVSYIQPRIEEIFTTVREEVQKSGLEDLVVPGGAVLTGGGSLLAGMPEAAGQILEMPVRVGLPRGDFAPESEKFLTPDYAAALGLLRFTPFEFSSRGTGLLRRGGGFWRRINRWIEDLF
jgi:cell division protein FtsA